MSKRFHMHGEERRILGTLIDNLSAAGFKPAAVWTDETYVMATAGGEVIEVESCPPQIARPLTKEEVLQVFEDYCMGAPTVHFTDQHRTTWGGRGVQVVPGNRSDFICDWHCGDKAFNAIVEQVGEAAYEGAYE